MKNKKAFSLIELMVVIAIIAILPAIALPLYQQFACRTKANEPLNQLKDVKAGFAAFSEDFVGPYPTRTAINDAFSITLPGTDRWNFSGIAVDVDTLDIAVTPSTSADSCLAGFGFTYRVDRPRDSGARYQVTTSTNFTLVKTSDLTGKI